MNYLGSSRYVRASAILLAIVLVAVTAAPALAWHGGPLFFFGLGSLLWAPFWWHYYPPYYPYASAPIVIEQPPVYVQQPSPPLARVAPPTTALPPPPDIYWYYCSSAGGYYPSVPQCAEPWVKVPPRPPQ